MIDPTEFDPAWYLQQYPDVAAAGIDPWEHFGRHGWGEGRYPRLLQSQVHEHYLWRGLASPMLRRLRSTQQQGTPLEQAYASWALCRWYAQTAQWQSCAEALQRFHSLEHALPGHAGPWLMGVEAAIQTGDLNQAALYLHGLVERFPNCPDIPLARCNFLGMASLGSANITHRQQTLNRLFSQHGLTAVRLWGNSSEQVYPVWEFDSLSSVAQPLSETAPSPCPRVSVMVPMYNAEASIATALRGLLAQTWPNLELLLVDDASSDATLAVVKRELAADPPRTGLKVTVLSHARNQGAYAARNTALAHATGDFITTHDSDDWSHPQKLEYQALALIKQPEAAGCFSHWVRATQALHFTHWCMEQGWIYRNISSLMIRRQVSETLGFWDNVSVAADTEFHNRLLAVYGAEALVDVLPGVPLAIGRQEAGSLTQQSDTHLLTMFHGLRQHYADAAKRWHAGFRHPRDAFLAAHPQERPFPAPRLMCRGAESAAHGPLEDLIQQSDYWDAAWYLTHYTDLQDAKIDPLAHFLDHGAMEGRDPGPHFSTSGYALRYARQLQQAKMTNPLAHFLRHGHAQGLEPHPVFPGRQPVMPSRPTVLLCGHQAPAQPFGAERCLIDTARALEAMEYNVLVLLPAAHSVAYLAALQSYVQGVAVVPYHWWRQGQASCPQAIAHVLEIIERYHVDAVHVNTLVQDAPCHAANMAGVPLVIHAHELPAHDSALCQRLEASAETIGRRALALADVVVANSQVVADFFHALQSPDTPGVPVQVVHNTLDMNVLLSLPPPVQYNAAEPLARAAPYRVGLLSNNQANKGLGDLAALAEHLATAAASGELKRPVHCVLYGPQTPELEALRLRRAAGELPDNLVFEGYIESPETALATLDAVVSLSHVQESFGRTVLEAMTAARPVIAYHWGALPELVVNAQTGYLVPFGDTRAVADAIQQLVNQPETQHAMGLAARQRAVETFRPRRYVQALQQVYTPLLASITASLQAHSGSIDSVS
ncbi:glycosyltransferase [Vreelandella salicampi]|uniref:Glycosyltransferase n=1 Tax=Vreelandella salicampi TaxID=1449798 RepID=A0A7Z0LK44_9GAMM|nr:glycosyltransferase [Halomonas salicampi]NYS60319.1 glycosyltransferase [Halomonas salicampi]